MSKRLCTPAIATILTLSSAILSAQSNPAPEGHWVTTWATSEQMAATTPDPPVLPPTIKMPDFAHMKGVHGPPPLPVLANNQTVRMIVHTSIAGHKIRLELSNAFDLGVVTIGDAHIALHTSGSSIDTTTDRELTFSGRKTIDLGPGQIIVTDPIALDLKPLSDLAVSLYIVKTQGTPTNHNPGLHTAYVSAGDTTAAASMPSPTLNFSYVWLRSLDVVAPTNTFAISCLGDSITDGFRTTVDANTAWPTLLASRLNQRSNGPRVAVLNAGISGNQVLHDGAGVSALARFDRDVLSEPGVRWIVLLEGINDTNIHGQINGPGALTADDLIAGYQQLIARAHLHGLKIMGATLTPEEGIWLAGPTGEATRQKLNDWIRHASAFDATIDFDAVVRDPLHPERLRVEFDSGDHIHPNDEGNAAMANAFDLNTFMQ